MEQVNVEPLTYVTTLFRTMSERELREKTSCTEINTEQGNLVNNTTTWSLTAELVWMIDVPIEELKCQKRTERINAFLPIPELTREEAEDLCHKFGPDVHIAGQFNSKEDFDNYYEGYLSNQKFIKTCGYYDNGRLKTWIPYRRNKDSTALVHDITQLELLANQSDKYYRFWYKGPQVDSSV